MQELATSLPDAAVIDECKAGRLRENGLAIPVALVRYPGAHGSDLDDELTILFHWPDRISRLVDVLVAMTRVDRPTGATAVPSTARES